MRSPLRPHPHFVLVAFALAAALALGACFDDDGGEATGTASPTATETASPSATGTQTPTPSRTASPTSTATPEPENPEPSTVVPTWIDGLATIRDGGTTPTIVYGIEYPAVPGLNALTDALDEEMRRQLAEEEARLDPRPEGANGPNVIITSEFLVASGDVIGIELRTLWVSASSGWWTTTLWFDLQTQEVRHAVDLLDGEPALAELAALTQATVRGTLDRLPASDQGLASLESIEEGTAPTVANYDTLGFDAEGRLIVSFDLYQVGGKFFPVRSIALDREVVEPLLSDFGRRVLAETVNSSGALNIEGTPSG